MELKYITDESGKPIEVIVPIAEWEKIKKKKSPGKATGRKNTKSGLLGEIREAVTNLNLVKKGKLKAKPLKELLDEL